MFKAIGIFNVKAGSTANDYPLSFTDSSQYKLTLSVEFVRVLQAFTVTTFQ